MSTEDFSKLENSGVLSVGEKPADGPSTVIVLGAPRSGTSAISGVLNLLGIYLGSDARAPVFEDLLLSGKLDHGDTDGAREIISQYDDKHSLWAYKRPGLAFKIKEFHPLFRRPAYIAIFRDIFSAANRNLISTKVDLLGTMFRFIKSNENIVDFVSAEQPYTLFISYEKLLQNPELIVREIGDFIGLNISDSQLKKAVDFIQPQPEDYLDASRVTSVEGEVTAITDSSISGWARYKYKFFDTLPTLSLFLDGQRVQTVTADLERQTAIETVDGGNEARGFNFDTSGHELSKVKEISIHPDDDIRPLPIAENARTVKPRKGVISKLISALKK